MAEPLQPVGVAVIGPGRMGGLYARILHQSALTRLVAVCGQREVTARKVATEMGVPVYTGARYRDMLSDHPQIEAVVVATSEWAHADPVAACLESGKHVLVEKPMATSPSDAVRMVREADRNGVQLMVCHSLRFDPRFAAMREAVVRGEIGEVLHLYSRRSSQPAAVDRALGRFPLAYWLLPHDIDLALWTSRSTVVRVMAFARSGGRRPRSPGRSATPGIRPRTSASATTPRPGPRRAGPECCPGHRPAVPRRRHAATPRTHRRSKRTRPASTR